MMHFDDVKETYKNFFGMFTTLARNDICITYILKNGIVIFEILEERLC